METSKNRLNTLFLNFLRPILLATITFSFCGPPAQNSKNGTPLAVAEPSLPADFFPLQLKTGAFICDAMLKQGWKKDYAPFDKNTKINPGHTVWAAFYDCGLNGKDEGPITVSVSKPGFKNLRPRESSAGACSVEIVGSGAHSKEIPPHEPSRRALQIMLATKASQIDYCKE